SDCHRDLHSFPTRRSSDLRSSEITALFSGDAIQTDVHSVATIIARGSSVLVFPNASVQFLGNAVELTQGTMAIATSEEMSARARSEEHTSELQSLAYLVCR